MALLLQKSQHRNNDPRRPGAVVIYLLDCDAHFGAGRPFPGMQVAIVHGKAAAGDLYAQPVTRLQPRGYTAQVDSQSVDASRLQRLGPRFRVAEAAAHDSLR